jgi:opacity protein-like surface antigen
MKKTEILGIFAALLIAVAMIAACMQAQEPDNSKAVITYKFYGGFVMPSYAIQELVVTKDYATWTITGRDGNITERFQKNLTNEQFDGIVKVFADNNFASFGDRYDEGQNYVTDVGFTDITFEVNGKSKTVTAYNVNNYMPSGLIRIREKLQETVEFTRTLDESQIKELAALWIRESPTYKYDGSDLRFVTYIQQESYPVRHVLTWTFTSSHAGYGDRSGKVTAQLITEHTIIITIIDGRVDSAVIDGKWDEKGQFLIGSELSLSYQPKMCEKTPWQVWEENSGRVYIRAPTDEEIIKHYYSSVYSIEVRDVKKIQLGTVSCQACDVCPETYRFGLTVNASEMQPLLDEGWVRVG